MRKLLILLIAVVAAVGCTDKKPNIDPYAKLALNAPAPKSKAAPTPPYSMDTIVRYAYGSIFRYSDGRAIGAPRGVAKHDLKNLKFWIGDAQDVLYTDKNGEVKLGYFVTEGLLEWVVVATYQEKKPTEWLDAYRYFDLEEFIAPNGILDTIAYIPNAQLRANEAAIKKAFDEQNYDLCLQLFESAYVFTPITGPEWRALKAQNKH